MKKTIVFLFSYICIICLFSCSSNEAVTCYLPTNTVKSNSPLVPGATLKLYTPEQSSDTQYNWTGPNNFQSNLQNPVITDLTTSMAGEYKLKTTKGICESLESSVLVEVNAPNIPCNIDDNTIVLNGDKKSLSSGYLSSVMDRYQITVNGSGASFILYFPNNVVVEPGIYTICNNNCPIFTSADSKYVSMTAYYGSTYSYPNEGFVYISDINGKFTIQFCDLKMNFYSIPFNVSAKVTVK